MATTGFLERMIDRMDRIDRKHLERYVLDLAQDKKMLTSLLDEVQDGVLVFTRGKKIVFLNRRMKQLFNLPDGLESSGSVPELFEDTPLAGLVADAVARQDELFHKELQVLLPRPMVLSITLQFEKLQRSEVAVLLVRDLSQNELRTREHFQIENLESMAGLAAGIAHEIGNPLNSISIHLQLLMNHLKSLADRERKKMRPALRAIQEETVRLDKIVRNFLGALRRKPLQFELHAIHPLLEKTLSLLEPELKAAKIRLATQWDERVPEFLLDHLRIHQVFLNIIKNAIHAMPKGGSLRIGTELKGKLCLIHFHDTGVGISDQDLPKIFDAYYTTREGGSGLGLMIVYQIVREHGGRIEVSSKLGKGTRFTVILPIRKEKLRLPEPVEK